VRYPIAAGGKFFAEPCDAPKVAPRW
jgi:hypothetical protein